MPSNTLSEQNGPHVCPHQIAFFLDNWFRRLIQNPKKILAAYINKGDTVIDMGCGPGFFTIDMAKMVGSSGKVIAIDLQEKMLRHVRKKASRHGVSDQIEYHQCLSDRIGYNGRADFILAFYMIHETPNPKRFLEELKSLLKDKGKILVVEPKMHVSQKLFEEMLRDAEKVGLKAIKIPKSLGNRSVIFILTTPDCCP